MTGLNEQSSAKYWLSFMSFIEVLSFIIILSQISVRFKLVRLLVALKFMFSFSTIVCDQ